MIDYQIGIIGSGLGGLGIAIQLKKQGHRSFAIFEKASKVGGTWRDNVYPGCACDVPSHLYSYSFEPNPNWSRAYSKQPEILDYILFCKEKYKLEAYIQYNRLIKEVIFDEKNACWHLTDSKGNTTIVKTVIAAIGPLSVPKIPEIKGLETFEGASCHSATWDEKISLKNKRVAVIGTGASAIQLVPAIAPEVAQLNLFQRTAPWVLPKDDAKISELSKGVFSKLPISQRLKRLSLYSYYEFAGSALFSDNVTRKITERIAKKHLEKQVPDLELRKKLQPTYAIGCKRRLPSNDYYPALMRDNVTLINEGIEEITPKGIIGREGNLHEVDVIIYATGFHVADFTQRGMTILGRNQQNLFDSWTNGHPEAYYGTAVSGYPGLLFILGPNTGLGHTSQLHIMESQFNYILDYINEQKKIPANSILDVKPTAQKRFNKELQKRLKEMVWSSGGCDSWYLDNYGQNAVIWPGYTFSYRSQTKKIIRKDFEAL